MELINLMQQISNKNIPHFLIFFGEEQTILNMYINHIADAVRGNKIIAENVSSVIKTIGRNSLDKSVKIYVIPDDMSFISAEDGWKSVKNFSNTDYLILRYHVLDKRSSFVKKNGDSIVEFPHLSKDVLLKYIQKDLPEIRQHNAYELIDFCRSDYGRILMEVDKIKHYIATTGYTCSSCFEALDEQGLFYKEIGDITFELTNAVLAGYPKNAIIKLGEAKRKGESAVMIASILYNGFRNLLAYQGLGNNKQRAMEKTNMTKGELYGCTKNVGGYNISELKRNMLICQRVEVGIKMGTIDEAIALDYLVLSCLS